MRSTIDSGSRAFRRHMHEHPLLQNSKRFRPSQSASNQNNFRRALLSGGLPGAFRIAWTGQELKLRHMKLFTPGFEGRLSSKLWCCLSAVALCMGSQAADKPFRPPAVPLVTSDPYLSIWSEADHLNDDVTRHWTHREHSLVSLIRIDGQAFRLMGNEPKSTPALQQTSVEVLPTRSIYQFENAQVHVTLTFMTPALPNDLDAFSLPLSYLTWDVKAMDGRPHAVSILETVSSQLVVNNPTRKFTGAAESSGGLLLLKVGTEAQNVLGSSGDDHRINWGYAYLSASAKQAHGAIASAGEVLKAFTATGQLPPSDDARMPRAVKDEQPVLAIAWDLGNVEAAPVSRHATVAYDEIFSIKYFGQNLRPYWRRKGASAITMLKGAERDYQTTDSALRGV